MRTALAAALVFATLTTGALAASVVPGDAYDFSIFNDGGLVVPTTGTADVGTVDINVLDAISVDVTGDLGPEVAITFGTGYDFGFPLAGMVGTDTELVLSGLDFGGLAVTGFELDPAGLFAGVTASLVGDSLTFSFLDQLVAGSAGDLLAGGRFVTTTPVPLPASALLLIGAFGALGAARKRRQKATA